VKSVREAPDPAKADFCKSKCTAEKGIYSKERALRVGLEST
jgi:hypothetical protein